MLTLAVVTYTMIGKEYVKLKDLTADFIKAGSKGSWNGHDIDIVLDKVLLKYSSLKIDWDKGAGEEWIRLYDDKYGIVCMMHCKIKIIFAKKIDLFFWLYHKKRLISVAIYGKMQYNRKRIGGMKYGSRSGGACRDN